MSDYIRVYIEGFLLTHSPLHIGSGQEQEWLESNKRQAQNTDAEMVEKTPRLHNAFVLDYHQRPYLPASSIRGYLRSQISDPELQQALFGLGRQKRGSDEIGQQGKLNVYDAVLDADPDAAAHVLGINTRTSIDAVTQTAAEHQLASHKQVRPGTRFKVAFILEDVDKTALNALLYALKNLNETNANARLGSGKSVGQGKIQWLQYESTVQWLTKKKFKQWLESKPTEKNDAQLPTPESMSFDGFLHTETLQNGLLSGKGSTPLPSRQEWKTIPFRLLPQSPILVNDPQRVQALLEESDAEDNTPPLMYLRYGQKACVPGSTLKGWLRAHCRKILLTLNYEKRDLKTLDYEKSIIKVKTMIDQLFGSTDRGVGVLQFSDALAEVDDMYDVHRQTFNAIDRFTGGAKHGALYTVEAVWPDMFQSQVDIRYERLEDWMKILLLYALRDAMEGDLILGWGKSKGYGRLMLKQETIQWDLLKQSKAEQWRSALDAELKAEQGENL